MNPVLLRALELNDKLSKKAADKLWPEVLVLSQERDECVKEYFSSAPNPSDKETILDITNQFKNTDKKIIDEISKNKRELVAEGLSLRNSHQAIKQYQNLQVE